MLRNPARLLLLAFCAACAAAPMRTETVSGDWRVIELRKAGGKLCYAGAFPARSEGSFERLRIPRAGKPYLMVTQRNRNAREVSASIGAPYLRGSKVELVLDGTIYSLFQQGSVAWARDGSQEAAILASLPHAHDIQLRGVGENGTTSIDHYSALGLSSALARIREHCA